MEEKKPIKVKVALILIPVVIILLIAAVVALVILTKDMQAKEEAKPETSQTTEIIDEDDYIYTKDIEKVVLKYYEGYNMASMERDDNKLVPENKVELNEKELKVVAPLINSLKEIKVKKGTEEYEHIIYDHMVDIYKLEINDDFDLYIGTEYGCTEKAEKYFEVPEELALKIKEIADKNSEENLYEKIGGTQFTIIAEDGQLEVTDEDDIKELANFKYYLLNDNQKNDELFADEEISYTLNSDNKKIEIFNASVISKLYDETKSYIYCDGLAELVDRIYGNSNVKIVDENVDKIIINYKDKEEIVEDKEEIEKLLKAFKRQTYKEYGYTKEMSEESFDEKDIKIHVGDTMYIIPDDEDDRYYIDEDGTVYSIGYLLDEEIEKYFETIFGNK